MAATTKYVKSFRSTLAIHRLLVPDQHTMCSLASGLLLVSVVYPSMHCPFLSAGELPVCRHHLLPEPPAAKLQQLQEPDDPAHTHLKVQQPLIRSSNQSPTITHRHRLSGRASLPFLQERQLKKQNRKYAKC